MYLKSQLKGLDADMEQIYIFQQTQCVKNWIFPKFFVGIHIFKEQTWQIFKMKFALALQPAKFIIAAIRVHNGHQDLA